MSIRRATQIPDHLLRDDAPLERPVTPRNRPGAARVTTPTRPVSVLPTGARPSVNRVDSTRIPPLVQATAKQESAQKVADGVAEQVDAAAREDAARHYFELMDRAFALRRELEADGEFSAQDRAEVGAIEQRAARWALTAGPQSIALIGTARFDHNVVEKNLVGERRIDHAMDFARDVFSEAGIDPGVLIGDLGDGYRRDAIRHTSSSTAEPSVALLRTHRTITAEAVALALADGTIDPTEKHRLDVVASAGVVLESRREQDPAKRYFNAAEKLRVMIADARADGVVDGAENERIEHQRQIVEREALAAGPDAIANEGAARFGRAIDHGQAGRTTEIDRKLDVAARIFARNGVADNELLSGVGDTFRNKTNRWMANHPEGKPGDRVIDSGQWVYEQVAINLSADGSLSSGDLRILTATYQGNQSLHVSKVSAAVLQFTRAVADYDRVRADPNATPEQIAAAKARADGKAAALLAAEDAGFKFADASVVLGANFGLHIAQGDVGKARQDHRAARFLGQYSTEHGIAVDGILGGEGRRHRRVALDALTDADATPGLGALNAGNKLVSSLSGLAAGDDGVVSATEDRLLGFYAGGQLHTVHAVNEDGRVLRQAQNFYDDAKRRHDTTGMAIANAVLSQALRSDIVLGKTYASPLAAVQVPPGELAALTPITGGDSELATVLYALTHGRTDAVTAWVRLQLGLGPDGGMPSIQDVTQANGFALLFVQASNRLDERLRHLPPAFREQLAPIVNDEKYRVSQVAMLYDSVTGQYRRDGEDDVITIHRFDPDRADGERWGLSLDPESQALFRDFIARGDARDDGAVKAIADLDRQERKLARQDQRAFDDFQRTKDRAAYDKYLEDSARRHQDLQNRRLQVVAGAQGPLQAAGDIDWGLDRNTIVTTMAAEIQDAKRIADTLPAEKRDLVIAAASGPSAMEAALRPLMHLDERGQSTLGPYADGESPHARAFLDDWEHVKAVLLSLPEWARQRIEPVVNRMMEQALHRAHQRDSDIGRYASKHVYPFEATEGEGAVRRNSYLNADGSFGYKVDEPDQFLDYFEPVTVGLATVFGGPLGGFVVSELWTVARGIETAAETGDPADAIVDPIARGVRIGIENDDAGLGLATAVRPLLGLVPGGNVVSALWSMGEAIDRGDEGGAVISFVAAVLNAAKYVNSGGSTLGVDPGRFGSVLQAIDTWASATGISGAQLTQLYDFARAVEAGDGPKALRLGIQLFGGAIKKGIDSGKTPAQILASLPPIPLLREIGKAILDPEAALDALLGSGQAATPGADYLGLKQLREANAANPLGLSADKEQYLLDRLYWIRPSTLDPVFSTYDPFWSMVGNPTLYPPAVKSSPQASGDGRPGHVQGDPNAVPGDRSGVIVRHGITYPIHKAPAYDLPPIPGAPAVLTYRLPTQEEHRSFDWLPDAVIVGASWGFPSPNYGNSSISGFLTFGSSGVALQLTQTPKQYQGFGDQRIVFPSQEYSTTDNPLAVVKPMADLAGGLSIVTNVNLTTQTVEMGGGANLIVGLPANPAAGGSVFSSGRVLLFANTRLVVQKPRGTEDFAPTTGGDEREIVLRPGEYEASITFGLALNGADMSYWITRLFPNPITAELALDANVLSMAGVNGWAGVAWQGRATVQLLPDGTATIKEIKLPGSDRAFTPEEVLDYLEGATTGGDRDASLDGVLFKTR